MDKFPESVSKRDFDRRISEVVEMLEEKQLYGTISLIKDLKYHLDLAVKEKTSCNCHHNSNSRDNESCRRCDRRQTNADRIRNMSDEELAELLHSISPYVEDGEPLIDIYIGENVSKLDDSHRDILEWLQSEAE